MKLKGFPIEIDSDVKCSKYFNVLPELIARYGTVDRVITFVYVTGRSIVSLG